MEVPASTVAATMCKTRRCTLWVLQQNGHQARYHYEQYRCIESLLPPTGHVPDNLPRYVKGPSYRTMGHARLPLGACEARENGAIQLFPAESQLYISNGQWEPHLNKSPSRFRDSTFDTTSN